MASPILVNERSVRKLSEFEFVHNPKDEKSKLGVGSFASVKLAKEKRSGKMQAIKIMCVHPSKISASDLHNIRTEITIHRKIDHPNIIKFYDYIQEDQNVYLILDYAENGNLYSYMHRRKSLTQTEIFRFFHQTCLAVQYLHSNDIIHRDLKPENLLLDKTHNIKICDFGWSTRRITEKRLTFCGTYEYMAPEIVYKKPYDYRVDIWSLGVLLYELIHKEAPYKGRSLPEITKSLARGQIRFSSSIHPDAKDLILGILKPNYEDRLSLPKILSHPWVRANLSRENPDSIIKTDQTKDVRLNGSENIFLESPKINQKRKDKENYKSEIFGSMKVGAFNDVLSPQIKRGVNAHLFSSFSGTTFPKERDHDKLKEKENVSDHLTLSNLEKALNNQDLPKRKPLQEFTGNTQQRTVHESLPSSRGHMKSSSSLTNQMLDKLVIDDGTPKGIFRRKRIFENNILSPNFKTKVNSIFLQISSNTTTHKGNEDMNSSFLNKILYQNTSRAASSQIKIPNSTHRPYDNYQGLERHDTQAVLSNKNRFDFKTDENSLQSISSFSSNLSRSKIETDNMKRVKSPTNTRKDLTVKIDLLKGDDILNYSSLSKQNRTARYKFDLRSPDSFEPRSTPISSSQNFQNGDFSKAFLKDNIGINTSTSNQFIPKNKDFGEAEGSFSGARKLSDYNRKPAPKFGDAKSLNQVSLNGQENRIDRKEYKRDLIRDKENQVVTKDSYIRNWF